MAASGDASRTTPEAVLEQLRTDIAAQPATEMRPIDAALARYDAPGLSWLEWSFRSNDDTPLPPPSQPATISDNDWQALSVWITSTAPQKELSSENGQVSFALLDLDDDGDNDLLLSYYIGGTGLYSTVETLRREGQHFTPGAGGSEDQRAGSFSINGRGGDQQIYYLVINGSHYIGYRDGDYLQDLLTLHRPLSSNPLEQTLPQALRVSYRHRHELTPIAGYSTAATPTQRALLADSTLVSDTNRQLALLRFDQTGKQHQPNPDARCPVPTQTPPDLITEEEWNTWPWRSAGHYTFDFVADLRVRGKQCYSASLVAFRSSYLRSYADCCALWVHDAPAADPVSLELITSRQLDQVRRIATPIPGDPS